MRKFFLTTLLTVSLAASAFATPPQPAAHWPTIDQQLKRHRVPARHGSREADPQQPGLRDAPAPRRRNDKIPVPLWLRVYWRKEHPEATYSAADPTGGYPHVLKEMAEWMQIHQELVADRGRRGARSRRRC